METRRYAAEPPSDENGPDATRDFGAQANPNASPDATQAFARQAPDPTAPPKIGDEIDDFLLVDHLGEGAFATVWLAHQKSMRRTVALKIAEAKDDEAITLAQLDHPNIVRVYDQRDATGRDLHLLYMEYVSGGTMEPLVGLVRRSGPEERSGRLLLETIDAALAVHGEEPPTDSIQRGRLQTATWPEAVCLLGAELAIALAHAHGQGVLHRDVKPGNVLLAPNGRAKLADFNVSSAANVEGASPEDSLGGSIAYMPPEQLEACSETHGRKASELDGRADLFALGVMLWELLAGTRPFPDMPSNAAASTTSGDDVDFSAALAATRRAGVPSEADARLPGDAPAMLVDTLKECLAPDPEARPADGAALARRLALCRDPRTRKLLTPATHGWTRWLRRMPLLGVVVLGLVPNVVLSVLNILYNLQVVLGGDWETFQQQVSVVNAVLYTTGVGLGLRWLWPVTRAVKRREKGVLPPPKERARLRGLALRLGDRLALLLLLLWIASGVTFPMWLHMRDGSASGEAFFHFTLSTVLFGLLAATLCFFIVNWLVSRVLLPRLIVPGDVDEPAAEQARRLARRTYAYFAACTAVPFISIIVLALQSSAHNSAFLALGVIGALGFGLTFVLSAATRRHLETLAFALGEGRSGPHAA